MSILNRTAIVAMIVFFVMSSSAFAQGKSPEQVRAEKAAAVFVAAVDATAAQAASDKKSQSKKETEAEMIVRLSIPVEGESEMDARVRERALRILLDNREKEATERRRKSLAPVERRAAAQVEDDVKREAKEDKKASERQSMIGLSCGKDEEGEIIPTDSVWVSDDAVQDYHRDVHSRVTVVNMTPFVVDEIRLVTGRGESVQVKNLCPNGRLNLIQWIGWSMNTYVEYTALLQDDSGRVSLSYSPRINLQACQSAMCQKEFPGVWEIKVR